MTEERPPGQSPDAMPGTAPGEPPRKPPQMSAAFVVLWVIGLLAFVALAGCTVLVAFFSLAEGSSMLGSILGLLIMGGALYWFARALRQGRAAERAQQPPNRVLLYTLLIPIAAGFIWAGGCVMAFSV